MEDDVLTYLQSRSEVIAVHAVASGEGCAQRAYELAVRVCGKKIHIRVVMEEPLGVYEPRFYLKDPGGLGLVPHVSRNGHVCYMESEGLLLDQDDPLGVLGHCLDRVIRTLEDGVSGKNKRDLFDEFEAPWFELAEGRRVKSFVELSPEPKQIALLIDEGIGMMTGDSDSDLHERAKRFGGRYPSPKARMTRGLYIPLASPILPRLPRTLDELRVLIRDHMSKGNWALLRGIVAERLVNESSVEFLLLSMPTPNGSDATGGIILSQFRLKSGRAMSGRGHPHPFTEGGLNAMIEAVHIDRCDYRHLVLRTSGEASLKTKHVLVAGCGSVGGFITMELARAGVTRLTLVDHDVLSADNIHRHILGASYLGKLKVHGLKEEIETKCPFARVTPVECRVEEFIKESGLPGDVDLVVMALGKPTIELYLNRFFRGSVKTIPVVYTWVEPYGVGGHALLVNGNAPGCLECLFHDPLDESEPLFNRASFAGKGQYFGKTISGCGSAFTPYACLDAVQTAILATRLSIEALLGRESRNPLLSWKGNTKAFEDQGFRLSDRARLTGEELFEQRYGYILDKCPVCGPGRRRANESSGLQTIS